VFTRLRWFIYGFVASLGATAYVVTRLRRLRERLTAQSVARVSALSLADAMALAGRRLAQNEERDDENTDRNRELAAR
jgi:hypothetical protein